MTYPDFLNLWRDADTEDIEVSTSGSTGAPKRILLPKRLMRMSAWRTIRHFGLDASSALHSCISPDYIGGKMMAVRAEECGAKLTFAPPSNTPELSIGPNERLDLVAVVPSQMWHILQLPQSARCRFLIGGSPIPTSLRQAIVAKGLDCHESYGMTETASHIALRRIASGESLFYPLPGVEVSLSDRETLTIRQGEGVPEIVTNDLARIHADGGFEILGRADNVIISGGLKIIPEDVERRVLPLLQPYGVDAVMLTSLPDAKWGERTVLIVELPARENATSLPIPSADTIIGLCRKVLRRHEVPKAVELTSTLPRTPNGKLKRH